MNVCVPAPTEYWDYWEWKDPAAEAACEVTPNVGVDIEDELPLDEPAVLPDEVDGEHPGPGSYAPDVEEAARIVDGPGGSTRTKKARWKKQLNQPFRALETFQRILAGVRVRLKSGKAARPQKG
ncbi:hypothetical protein LXA43DRAFT_1101924 [Ganoderma leucocontextum]|nr:hypothetical protein LXA43DRAFT_1101924 [Ganoderma leucocontextum]